MTSLEILETDKQSLNQASTHTHTHSHLLSSRLGSGIDGGKDGAGKIWNIFNKYNEDVQKYVPEYRVKKSKHS